MHSSKVWNSICLDAPCKDKCKEAVSSHIEEVVEARTSKIRQELEHLQRSQISLIQTEKLAALGIMVAGISHELNTPLSNAHIVATTMKDGINKIGASLDKGALRKSELENFISSSKEMVELLERSIRRSNELVLDFKKVAADKTNEIRRIFDLRESINIALESFFVQHRTHPSFEVTERVEVENHVPSGMEVDSYPDSISQILAILLHNSLVHAYPDGRKGVIKIHADFDGDVCVLYVVDDGCGMSVTTVVHAFDPFFTTRFGRGGKGIGLSIAKRIATSVLSGDLHIESSSGKGSALALVFPRMAPGSSLGRGSKEYILSDN